MPTQSVIALTQISLSAVLAAMVLGSRRRGDLAIVAGCCIVMFGGGLALWIVQNWAGWLTTVLFVPIVAWPIAFGWRASIAASRGEWGRASRLLKSATIFYRSAGARFNLNLIQILQAHDRGDSAAAYARIEALDTEKHKSLAHLELAFARRDWPSVLAHVRADGMEPYQSPIEIRALGELHFLEEMVQAYKKADRFLGLKRPYVMLNILAFTGEVKYLAQILHCNRRKIKDDDKLYWVAVAQLRRAPADQAAQETLARLKDAALGHGLRLAAAAHLHRLKNNAGPLPTLSSDSQSVISGIIQRVLESQRRQTRARRRLMATRNAMLWLVFIWIALALLKADWGEGSRQQRVNDPLRNYQMPLR